jgi:hypothetical protein
MFRVSPLDLGMTGGGLPGFSNWVIWSLVNENPVLTADQHGLPLMGETAEEKADSSLRFGMTSARAAIS